MQVETMGRRVWMIGGRRESWGDNSCGVNGGFPFCFLFLLSSVLEDSARKNGYASD